MSTPSTTVTPATSEWVPSPLHRLSLEQYEAIVESGVFTARDRFHLINGFLVARRTRNDPHCTADELCGAALGRAIPDGWHIRSAKPARLPGQVSKPEPDRSVVRGSIRDYSQRSPGAADVALRAKGQNLPELRLTAGEPAIGLDTSSPRVGLAATEDCSPGRRLSR